MCIVRIQLDHTKDYEMQYNQTIENGLIMQWCGSGCGHYVTTREILNETEICQSAFHTPKYIGWRMDYVTQEEMVSFLRHQPYCADCIRDNNSYGFPAYNDLSREDVDKVINLYIKNYPKKLRQPFFYSQFNNKILGFRIKTNSVIYNGQTDGDLDIETMIIEFTVCTQRGEHNKKWIHQDHIFDLSNSRGWNQMLETFPQPLLLKND